MIKIGTILFCMLASFIMFCAQAEACEDEDYPDYHCVETVTPKDEPDKEWERVDREFSHPPKDGVSDLIRVKNAVKGIKKDTWPDPVNSNVVLEWVERNPDEGELVEVRVVDRENDRLVYYVKVEEELDEVGVVVGDAPGEPPVGWAEVRGREPGDLLLRDEISGREETDSTIEDDDRPLLYCCTDEDGKGKVFFNSKMPTANTIGRSPGRTRLMAI